MAPSHGIETAAAPLQQSSSMSSQLQSFTSQTGLLPSSENATQLEEVYRKISMRLIPLFLGIMILNHVDRTNLAYAAPTMNRDLGFGPAVYGLGAALFFLPFCVFQIPSNLVMLRVGVRRWMAFLLFCWGCLATCQALIHDKASLFALRLLLGVFEAGAVPAMWYHLSVFYTDDRMTKPFTYLVIGVLVAQAASGPIAAGLLAMDGVRGLRGWQWLFMLEGLPTVIMSAVVLWYLPDSPDSVSWLTEQQKRLLEQDRAISASMRPRHHLQQQNLPQQQQQQKLVGISPLRLLWGAMCNPLLLYMCFLGILLAATSHTYVFFLPMIIAALLNGGAGGGPGGGAGSKSQVLLPIILTCIPYTLACVSSYLVATSSEKRKELYFHTAVPAMIGGIFFVLFPFLARASMIGGFVCLVFVSLSGASAIGPKSAIVHKITVGPTQVVGMPLYNSIVVLGGFIGPTVTGFIVQRTGNFTGISVLFGILLVICSFGIFSVKYIIAARDRRLQRQQGGFLPPQHPGSQGASYNTYNCYKDEEAAEGAAAVGSGGPGMGNLPPAAQHHEKLSDTSAASPYDSSYNSGGLKDVESTRDAGHVVRPNAVEGPRHRNG